MFLTPLCESLHELFGHLCGRTVEHSEEIQNCRRAHDSSRRSLATDTAPARVSTPNLP